MNPSVRKVGWVLLLLCLVGCPGAYALDSIEEELRRMYEQPLRWDQIEGAPEWVSGQVPEKRGLGRGHEVQLAPGEQVCVRIPPQEILRVQVAAETREDDALAVALSNGSGLLTFVTPDREEETGALLIRPERDQAMLAYLFREADRETAVGVGLFVSRRPDFSSLVAYRELAALHPDSVRLKTSVESDPQAWWPLEAGRGYPLDLPGDRRYRLEVRYRYPASEARLPQTFQVRLRARNEGITFTRLDLATSHETAHLVWVSNQPEVVSRLERTSFDLPDPHLHEVELSCSASVYARLLVLEHTEYAIPALNAAKKNPNDLAPLLSDPDFVQGSWSIPAARLAGILRAPEIAPAGQVEQAAYRLARDNRQREGGLMAANLLWRAGRYRADYPEIRQRARELRGFRTYFREVLPANAIQAPIYDAYFPVRTLQEIGRERPWLVAGLSHREAGYKRLPKATFTTVAPGAEEAEYPLTERDTFTWVRLAVDRRNLDQPIDFQVQFGDDSPVHMRMLPLSDCPELATKPTQGEAALRLMAGGSLDVASDLLRGSAPTVPAATYEWMQPAECHRVRISTPVPLPVAIQVRGSDVFECSEDEYAAVIAELGGAAEVFPLLERVLREHPFVAGAHPERELANHWEPLLRFVRSRVRQFEDSVVARPQVPIDANHLAEGRNLLAEGETFLGERVLREVYLHATQAELRQAAYADLLAIAGQQLDAEADTLLRTVDFGRHPTLASAEALCRQLRAEGEAELALTLSLMLPPEASTRELRLACSYHKRWWRAFAAVAEEDMDDPVVQVWFARQASFFGWHEDAIDWLEYGLPATAGWLADLQRHLQLRQRIDAGERTAVSAWADLEEQHPGHKHWDPIPASWIQAAAGNLTVRAVEREKFFQAYLVEPGRPLQLRTPAPGRLRIACRPLHAMWAQSPVDGWITVNVHGVEHPLPVSDNYRSPGLVIAGKPLLVPGTQVSDQVAVEAWMAPVTIASDEFPIMVRVFRESAEAPWGVLPKLDVPSAAWLFDRERISGQHPFPGAPDYGSVVYVDPAHETVERPLGPPGSWPEAALVREVERGMARLPESVRPLPNPGAWRRLKEARALLWRSENDPSVRNEAHAWAGVQQHFFPHEVELSRVCDRIQRGTHWQPVLGAHRSAGVREIEIPGWRPESPALRARLAVLPALADDEQLVSGSDGMVAVLNSRSNRTVQVRLALVWVPSLRPGPVRVRYEVEGQAPEEVVLRPEHPERTFSITAPRGRCHVRVDVVESRPNHYLKVGLSAETDGEGLARSTRRDYQVALPDQPVELRIEGPAWLRIDRWVDERTVSSYRYFRAGQHAVELVARESETLYRAHVLRADPEKTYIPPPFVARAVAEVPAPVLHQTHPPGAAFYRLHDAFALGAQEDGTLSLGLGAYSRRTVEEDSAGGREPERFLQAEVTHRIYVPRRRAYVRSRALFRVREEGAPVVGAEHRQQIEPYAHPWTYAGTVGGLTQDGEHAVYTRGTVAQTREWNPEWSHSPSLRLFGRAQSLDRAGDRPEEIDQDIYSDYKRDHRYGWRLGHVLDYRPRRDSRLRGEAFLASNEDLNPFNPDYAGYALHGRQRLGAVQAGASFRGTYYFADDDRTADVWRHRLLLDATADRWLARQRRMELGAGYTYFVEEGEHAFYLLLRLHLGAGRMLQDFRPGELPFRDQRSRDVPQTTNNRLEHGH